ncbi:hypothetical protein MKW92_052626 [Papaver armeniacum]|nr:hypothetical protein MKW92_052626 [Papaver armeniacum]
MINGKKNKYMGVCERKDRISELPESILHHILSFLPMKCIASTSVLSRQWRIMNLCDGNMPNIKRLCLELDDQFDKSRINGWISNAIRRNAEEIYLEVQSEYILSFPLCVFSSGTLARLELEMNCALQLPKSVSLPSLKSLVVSHVVFINDNSSREFFSNCPVLEDLVISSCRWINMNVLCISAPALKWLSFDAENASGSLDDIRVEIHAPNLLFFRFWEYVKRSYDLRNFTSLTYAEIDMFVDMSPFTREQIYHSARELLGGLSNVEHLKLSVDVFDALSFEGNRINNLPKFYNLTNLEATFMFSCSSNGVLLDLLEISPNLESLVFSEGLNPSETDDDDTWKLNLMTPCLLPKLTSIEVQIFKGTSRELILAIQFLKNARVLQRMDIKFSSSLSIIQKNKAMEQLLTFPRGSPSCVVNFL